MPTARPPHFATAAAGIQVGAAGGAGAAGDFDLSAAIAVGAGVAERLAIEGGSAGGLLIGAVLNLRPDLFGAAHLAVPFVDVINTMCDETLPLTTGECLEWGDPRQEAAFEYMLSYSPYDKRSGAGR